MIQSVAELTPLLTGSVLEDREVVDLDVPVYGMDARAGHVAPTETVLAVRIGSAEIREAWQAARALVDETGRWPVAVCSWELGGGASSPLDAIAEVLDRTEFGWELAGPADPPAILARSVEVDVDAALAAIEAGADEWYDPPASGDVDTTPAEGYLDWFEPRDQPMALLLLPAPYAEAVLAYVHWFAAGHELPSHVVVALVRRWREQFGAELVAHWGTMLQFAVTRPPTTIDDARELARTQVLVAPCTTQLVGVSTEQHAVTLLGADTWFLHERP